MLQLLRSFSRPARSEAACIVQCEQMLVSLGQVDVFSRSATALFVGRGV